MEKIRILAILTLVAISIFSVSSCSKPSDQKLYEEVITTMSMAKAKQFFQNYPNSHYSDKLAAEIVGWCKQEATEDSCIMVLDAIPEHHPLRKEIATYYETHFKKQVK